MVLENPHCHFCGREVNFEDSGLYSVENSVQDGNGIHIDPPTKVLACLACIYGKRSLRGCKGSGKNQKRRQKLLEADPHCHYCKCEVDMSNSTLDHLVPRAKGGKNSLDNVVLCCYVCNHKKGVKTAKEFMAILAKEKSHGNNPGSGELGQATQNRI